MHTNKLRKLARRGVMLRSFVRKCYLRLMPGVSIGAGGYIGPNATIDLLSDGFVKRGVVIIGRKCNIGTSVLLTPYGGRIELADGVFLGPYTVIYGHGGVSIGENTLVGHHSSIIAESHVYGSESSLIRHAGETMKGVAIGRNCWIGAGVRILDGVSIADNSVIGANSVVNRSLDSAGVYVGAPARLLKKLPSFAA